MLKKITFVVFVMNLVFTLVFAKNLGIDPINTLGGTMPQPTTTEFISDSSFLAIFNIGIAISVEKWTFFAILLMIPLLILAIVSIRKLPNDVQNSNVRHETFNTIDK